MKAKDLYKKLDAYFELEKCRDDWRDMDFNEFIADNFKQRYMGLVLDNSQNIVQVYTAVFPSDKVLNKILNSKKEDILLFTHHPMIWDSSRLGYPFKDINKSLLIKLRERKISLYSLHVPLDRNGEYSTAVSLAKAISIIPENEFYEYFGVKAGIIGKTNSKTIVDLAQKVSGIVGHRVKIWNYGTAKINKQQVALVAGGGNSPEAIREVAGFGINVFVTGVTLPNKNYKPSIKFHELARASKINVIGATHYSTEKFACQAVVKYFKKLNLPAVFISDEPNFNDLDEMNH